MTGSGAAERERIEAEADELCAPLRAPVGDDGALRPAAPHQPDPRRLRRAPRLRPAALRAAGSGTPTNSSVAPPFLHGTASPHPIKRIAPVAVILPCCCYPHGLRRAKFIE
jgi:hypothetical protein